MKKKKTKKSGTDLVSVDFPRHQCIVYSEKLDPRFNDFKTLVEKCWHRFNNKDYLLVLQKCAREGIRDREFIYGEVGGNIYSDMRAYHEDLLTKLLYNEIIKRGGGHFFPYCTFQIDHHLGLVFKIKVSSFFVKKCGNINAYYPQRPVFMKYEGREFELGFSRHAVQRLGERVVVGTGTHLYHHIFFMYINNNLQVKKDFVCNKNTNKKTVCAVIYRQLHEPIKTDATIIDRFCLWDKIDPDIERYDYYLKVGYAPLAFDRETGRAIAKTVLIPGMKGTVENDILTNKNGEQSEEDIVMANNSYEQMKTSKDAGHDGNFFRFWCHVKGMNQLIRIPKTERGFRYPHLSKLYNAAEFMRAQESHKTRSAA